MGRIGSAVLQAIGHPQWIANSEDDYVDKVVTLAQDTQALQRHRVNLRGPMQRSSLMDERGFAAKVEQAYRDMFQRWATNKGEPFVVANGVTKPGKTKKANWSMLT